MWCVCGVFVTFEAGGDVFVKCRTNIIFRLLLRRALKILFFVDYLCDWPLYRLQLFFHPAAVAEENLVGKLRRYIRNGRLVATNQSFPFLLLSLLYLYTRVRIFFLVRCPFCMIRVRGVRRGDTHYNNDCMSSVDSRTAFLRVAKNTPNYRKEHRQI